MPRNVSEDVFLLIKSLTKPEKRYFRFFAGMGNTSDNLIYLRLFDAIDVQKKYDEKKILKKVEGAKAHQLSNQKKYLSELIIESLRIYHAHRSVDSRLWAMISEIEVLFNKRLFAHASKQIKKAKALAEKYEKHRQLAEILTWEEKILVETISSEKEETEIGNVFSENISVSKKMLQTVEYRMLMNETVKLFRKGGLIRNKANAKRLENIISHPIIRKSHPSSYHEWYYYHNVFGMYHMMRGDWKKSYDSRKNLLQLIESHPQQIEDAPRLYLSALNNFIITCEYTHNTRELEESFHKVNDMMHKPEYISNDFILLRLLGCCNSVLHYYIHAGEFSSGVQLIEQIEESFNKLGKAINKTSEMSFNYTFAYIYFGSGNFRRAILWLNKILNDTHSDVRDDIRVFASLFSLIVHYELGNARQLDYFVRSTYRFLSKRHRLYKIETIILDFIKRKIPKTISRKELNKAFARLKSEIENLAKDPLEKKALEYFDFVSWLESKISNRDFADVVKEKNSV